METYWTAPTPMTNGIYGTDRVPGGGDGDVGWVMVGIRIL